MYNATVHDTIYNDTFNQVFLWERGARRLDGRPAFYFVLLITLHSLLFYYNGTSVLVLCYCYTNMLLFYF